MSFNVAADHLYASPHFTTHDESCLSDLTIVAADHRYASPHFTTHHESCLSDLTIVAADHRYAFPHFTTHHESCLSDLTIVAADHRYAFPHFSSRPHIFSFHNDTSVCVSFKRRFKNLALNNQLIAIIL